MTKHRFTDDEYAEMAADYAANPPTADEVLSVEINPAFLRKGRPTKGTPPVGKTPVLAIRLPDAIRGELTRRAKSEGSTASELIRRAVVEYFDNHPVRS